MRKVKIIFSGIAWTVINNVVSIFYGIVSVPFLINYFGKEYYGLIGLAMSINVYIHLLEMGMTNTNVRFFSEFIAKKDSNSIQRLFNLTQLLYLILGGINALILLLISFYIDILFKLDTDQANVLKHLLWILGLNSFFSWLSICFDQYIKANELVSWTKKRTTLLKIMQFIILASTIFFDLSIEYYFTGYIMIMALLIPISIIKIRKLNPGLKFDFGFDFNMFKLVMPYTISVFSFGIFQFLAFNARPLLLGYMVGPSSVADFGIMNTIASVVAILSGSFMQVLLPTMTKMNAASDSKGLGTVIYDGTKYVNLALSFLIFLLIGSLKEIFILYVGEDYTKLVGWTTVWLLVLLLSHRNVMTSLVFTQKKLSAVAIMGAVAMIGALSAYYFFIPVFGVGGVVLGFCIHEIIHTLFYYMYYLPTKFRLRSGIIFIQSVLPIWLVFGLISYLGVLIVDNFSLSVWSALLIKCSVLGSMMITFTWGLLLNKHDKAFLMSVFFKRA